MELRREIFITIGVLVALNIVLAFGCIGLFVRMGPAIERILQENVYSIVAAEGILSELAEAGDTPLDPGAKERVQQALQDAKRNVTEDAEETAITMLEQVLPAAMEGDRAARRQATEEVRSIISINRGAMRNVDRDARRLGSAGAWAAVFVGFLSFLLSIFVVLRLKKRFVRPLVDLYEVLEEAREGEGLRRCRLSDSPREVLQVMESVNKLLDERLELTGGRARVPLGEDS